MIEFDLFDPDKPLPVAKSYMLTMFGENNPFTQKISDTLIQQGVLSVNSSVFNNGGIYTATFAIETLESWYTTFSPFISHAQEFHVLSDFLKYDDDEDAFEFTDNANFLVKISHHQASALNTLLLEQYSHLPIDLSELHIEKCTLGKVDFFELTLKGHIEDIELVQSLDIKIESLFPDISIITVCKP